MRATKLDAVFGRNSRDRLTDTVQPGLEGALAALETFYYAFNQRDADTLRAVWLDDKLVQLNNPVGGVLYGADAVRELYERIFAGSAKVWVDFGDIVRFAADDVVIFAGYERGEFVADHHRVPLVIRTSRVFGYQSDVGWRQIHHHGSIDEPGLLHTYQDAVTSSSPRHP